LEVSSTADGIVRYPTFSPDGTQIAFVEDYCDHNHNVWVMNADGSDAHQIVSDRLGAGHVRGLAWSASGDRIALLSDVGSYTFARDGSDFTEIGHASPEFCWPRRQC
jgi:Tol biopolymer transport system component